MRPHATAFVFFFFCDVAIVLVVIVLDKHHRAVYNHSPIISRIVMFLDPPLLQG